MVAIRDYVEATDEEVDHVVLGRRRAGHDTGDLSDVPVLDLVGRTPRRIRTHYLRTLRAVRPDVVHAHSSWAGVLARVATPDGVPIVYTPHCYAFERTDVSGVQLRGFRAVERLLARRTAVVAACSPREQALARTLRESQRTAYVPNVARRTALPPRRRSVDPAPVVVACGRLAPQKDPAWFARFTRALHGRCPEARVRWLGGGTPSDETALRAAGVEVTGWLPRTEVLEELAAATVYVHTAAWEGAPLTVLEAAAMDVPVVGRRIASLESLGLVSLYREPEHAAAAVDDARADGFTALTRSTRTFARGHLEHHQRNALLDAYGVALGRRIRPGLPDVAIELPRPRVAVDDLIAPIGDAR